MPTGSVTPAGGGGGASVVYKAGYYYGNNVSVANNASGILTWNGLNSGTAMLDLTTPALPLVLKAGLFVVCVQVQADNLSPGGSISADLILDYGNDNVESGDEGLQGSPSGASAVVMASYVLAAGAAIRLDVHNDDGVLTRNLRIVNATIARIGPA